MANNILKTRIKHRIDTATNWTNLTEPPMSGEFIIYAAEGDIPAKLKIGDGVTTASNLPFVTDVDINNLSAGVRIPESDTNSLGSAIKGIYWSNGRPQLMTHTLEKSVPADAIFPDNNYTNAEKAKLSGIEEGANKTVYFTEADIDEICGAKFYSISEVLI